MADIGMQNYVEKLVNTVAKNIVEAFENLTIEEVNMYKFGYNKAIDDFVENIMVHCSMSEMNRKMIKQIAEQLKGDAEE